jgi:hypothetical protein
VQLRCWCGGFADGTAARKKPAEKPVLASRDAPTPLLAGRSRIRRWDKAMESHFRDYVPGKDR